jgi:flagellar biosynthesis/type III secretory pathway protein FliH
MTQSTPQKFEFGTVFDKVGTVVKADTSWRKNISIEEANKKAAEAFDKGRQEEVVTAERETKLAIDALVEKADQVLGFARQMSEQCRSDAAHLALTIAGKIAGSALQNFEQQHVIDLIARTLVELKGDPKVVITVSSALVSKLEDRMKQALEHSDFSGSIRVIGGEDVTTGSVALEWNEGSVRFDPKEVEARIESEIENWLVTMGEQGPEQPAPEIENEGNSNG